MPVIQRYRPTPFQGLKNEERSYTSLEELLTIYFVNHFSKLPGFFRFSVTPHNKVIDRTLLMAEYKNGNDWFVAGYIDGDKISEQLPVFKRKDKEEKKYESF